MSENPPTIDELFKLAAESLKFDFEKIRKEIKHHATSGQECEELLIKFLNNHLPRRFCATSGFVIDSNNSISKQSDILIYDAENSPVYRANEKAQILPADSIASIIEVKSMLDKSELIDAAEKIASVKSLHRTELTNMDQPVNFTNFITNTSLGIVFAYDSKTTLKTLAKNLKEINKKMPRAHWVDVVVVLGKGMIGYCSKLPGEDKAALMLPETSKDFIIPPFYVYLSIFDDANYALNRFFLNLMSVLTFFRKRTSIPFSNLLKGSNKNFLNICGYWYNTNRELVEVPEEQVGKGKDALITFDVFEKFNSHIIARYKIFEWADGYVYEITPPTHDSLQILKTIVRIKSKEHFTVIPFKNGIVALSTLLKERPADINEIVDKIQNQLSLRIEIR